MKKTAPRNTARACATRGPSRRYRPTARLLRRDAWTSRWWLAPPAGPGRAPFTTVVNATPEPAPPRTSAGNHSSSGKVPYPPSPYPPSPSAPAPRASVKVTLARSLGVSPNSAHARRSAPPGPHAASTATPAGCPGTRDAAFAASLVARLAPSVSSVASSAAATTGSRRGLPRGHRPGTGGGQHTHSARPHTQTPRHTHTHSPATRERAQRLARSRARRPRGARRRRPRSGRTRTDKSDADDDDVDAALAEGLGRRASSSPTRPSAERSGLGGLVLENAPDAGRHARFRHFRSRTPRVTSQPGTSPTEKARLRRRTTR